MERNWKMRFIFIVIVVLGALIAVAPSLLDQNKYPFLTKINEGLNLGLDLKGGIHFVLNVDVEKAIQDKIDRMTDDIMKRMDELKLGYESVKADPVEPIIHITLKPGTDKNVFQDKVLEYFGSMKRIDSSGNRYSIKMRDDYIEHLKENAVEQALETLRNRIDGLGLKEPIIAKQGTNSILIQLPGYKDVERARSIIGQTAQLEFKIVAEGIDPLAPFANSSPEGIKIIAAGSEHYAVSENRDLLKDFLKDKAPEGYQFLLEEKTNETGKKEFISYLVEKKAYLTGDMLTDASVQIDRQRNRPYVSLSFDRNGARIFEEVTGKFIKRRLAIVLDDTVNSAPVIQSKIAGGNAMITLNSMKDYNSIFMEAKDLALVLRAGSLPAPVTFEENRTVGPSLGADSIKNGKISALIGFSALALAMIVYYGVSGVIAVFGLILNVLLIFAAMSILGSTLTFPGIAGIVLTMGMAVDANVIIYERTREELKKGTDFWDAMNQGYDKAFSAIFDSNITTAIAGFVLWSFGSGPIKGFAITLLLGIASTMFTAIYVTRLFMNILRSWGIKKFSI